jgi:acyl-CoA hydrolase
MANPKIFDAKDSAVDYILSETCGQLRLAMPLGIGKPNPVVNALYQKIKKNPQLSLSIYTALSLLKPQAHSDLEQRFLNPLIDRLYGNYPDLDYALDLQKNTLASNVSVHEFFLKSGDWLNQAHIQQNYISSNYTHIARDMVSKNINVLAQAVAGKFVDGQWQLSLSCNPDVSLELIERLEKRRSSGEKILLVAMLNRELPYMPGAAEVSLDTFDLLITDESCTHTLFCTPNMKVHDADYAIGLHASSLVQDGGTLQIGIGSLGDAIAQSLIVRDKDNKLYKQLINKLQDGKPTITTYDNVFDEGLYGCSEMFVNGLLELIKSNIIRREVTGKDNRRHIFHGGFFIGPKKFYESLRTMPEENLAKIEMERISFINQLYGDETLKRQHRTKASFVNTCMMVTLSGAAVSDALDSSKVVSGVGGQYNFVAMAHELEEARSILMLRSFRVADGKAKSNIVANYGHCTIPRHLRDIVITEYGIADLRGKTDSEVIKGLLAIADSRFQEELLAWAVANGKVEKEYLLPASYQKNNPESVSEILRPYRTSFTDFPFGHDFTEDELVIIHALEKIKAAVSHPLENISSIVASLLHDNDVPEKYLARMGFKEGDSLKTKILKKLFTGNL